MKPTPICAIIRNIRPLAPFHKAAHLRALIACEPKRGYRRRELEALLKEIVTAQLKRERRAA